MMKAFKFLLIASAVVVMTGCKVSVMVSTGGFVQSLSGARNCAEGNLCEYDVVDTSFTESFTAVAKTGYVFSYWQEGNGFLCGSSTNPVCNVSSEALPVDQPNIAAFLASGQVTYLLPRFVYVGVDTDGDGIKDHIDVDDDNDGLTDVNDPCPLSPAADCGSITDTVFADGKIWAQPDLFLGIDLVQLRAVCPEGACDGVLNGYDLTGWTWASLDDVNSLFNYYIGTDELGPGRDSYQEVDSTWAFAFDQVWRRTFPRYPPRFNGVTSTFYGPNGIEDQFLSMGTIKYEYFEAPYAAQDSAETVSFTNSDGILGIYYGVWLYRIP